MYQQELPNCLYDVLLIQQIYQMNHKQKYRKIIAPLRYIEETSETKELHING